MELLEYDFGENLRAFSTLRHSGGEGRGAYASFNLTHYCGDQPENVARCRAELAQALGIEDSCLLLPRQTHGDGVCHVDEQFLRLTAAERCVVLDGQDALVTRLKGVCIGVSTADCLPILLYDPQERIVAAVHAGWRGLVQRIPQRVIEVMQRLGSSPSSLYALIGPSIACASFEVGEEVVDAFRQAHFPGSVVSRVFTRPHIDLWAAACVLLEESGVELSSIRIAGIDTFTATDMFFSARRLGALSGRIYTGIMLQ